MRYKLLTILLTLFIITGCNASTSNLEVLEDALTNRDAKVKDAEKFSEDLVKHFEDLGLKGDSQEYEDITLYYYSQDEEDLGKSISFAINNDDSILESSVSLYMNEIDETDISIWSLNNSPEESKKIIIYVNDKVELGTSISIEGEYDIEKSEFDLSYYLDRGNANDIDNMTTYDVEADEYQQMEKLKELVNEYIEFYNMIFNEKQS